MLLCYIVIMSQVESHAMRMMDETSSTYILPGSLQSHAVGCMLTMLGWTTRSCREHICSIASFTVLSD
jgi:hypothetical protein